MKKIFLAFLFLLVGTSLALATPPHDMQLVYDPAAQALAITMKHPTDNINQHYIRFIYVSVNGGEPKVYRFNFQKPAWGVETTVPLALKPGDKVHVKATCIKGGSDEADLNLPLPAPTPESNEK